MHLLEISSPHLTLRNRKRAFKLCSALIIYFRHVLVKLIRLRRDVFWLDHRMNQQGRVKVWSCLGAPHSGIHIPGRHLSTTLVVSKLVDRIVQQNNRSEERRVGKEC